MVRRGTGRRLRVGREPVAERPEQVASQAAHQSGSQGNARSKRDGQTQSDDGAAVVKLPEIGKDHHAQAQHGGHSTGSERATHVCQGGSDRLGRRREMP